MRKHQKKNIKVHSTKQLTGTPQKCQSQEKLSRRLNGMWYLGRNVSIKKKKKGKKSGVAQLAGLCSEKQKVTGFIPDQGTNLGCRFGTWSERVREATNQCFSATALLPSLSFSLPSPQSKNK